MFRIPRQSYTEEFKREAVKLVESGMNPSEVSRQLGISEQTLGNWRKAKAAGKLAGNGKVVTPAQMELSRLRAEVIRLKAENEILKKPRRTSRRSHCEVRLDRTATRYLADGVDVRSAGCQRQWIYRMEAWWQLQQAAYRCPVAGADQIHSCRNTWRVWRTAHLGRTQGQRHSGWQGTDTQADAGQWHSCSSQTAVQGDDRLEAQLPGGAQCTESAIPYCATGSGMGG